MALMRPTGLGSGIDKDRPDFGVYSGELCVGRIYQTRGDPESLRWCWSLTVTGPMTCSDEMPTLEEAKVQFQKSWDAWPSWKRCRESFTRSGSAPTKTSSRCTPIPVNLH